MIQARLESIPSFVGVFAADRLPDQVPIPCFLVANTDVSNEPGEHWIAIALMAGGSAVFFNSFGLPPLVPEIVTFIRRNAPNHLKYSNIVLQDGNSESCGWFCIAFIEHLARGGTLESFVALFTHVRRNVGLKNERILAELVQSSS